MSCRAASRGDKRCTAVLLQQLEHLFRFIALAADHQINVIGHNGATVACVAVLTDSLPDARRNEENVLVGKQQARLVEKRIGLLVESVDRRGGRLNRLSAKMQWTKRRQFLFSYFIRRT